MISPQLPHKRPTSVALYLPNLDGGGAERMMANLASGFAQRGLKVDMVLAEKRGPYLSNLTPDVEVIDLKSSGVVASLPKLVAYLRRAKPRALLATLPHASAVALLAVKLAGGKTRTVIRESNMLFSGSGKTLRGKVLIQSVKRTYPWADAHITVSQGVAHDLVRFAAPEAEKIHTIYNPVVTPALFAQAAEPLDHPWFAPNSPPVVLGVGRLVGQKDFETLIQAFAQVRQDKAAKLVILGEGGRLEPLQNLARELGVKNDVAFPGFVQNPFAYMARADTFVLSSKFEGLPGALIQAMACGCKIVSTDCPSGPAEILKGGELAPLIPVGDANAMATAIRAQLDTPQADPRLKARAQEFSDDAIIPEYLDVLLPSWREHVSSEAEQAVQ